MILKQLKRDRDGMLDMSPDNALNLKMAANFDPKDFVAKDIELGISIRNTEIKLEIAKERYNYLFTDGEK